MVACSNPADDKSKAVTGEATSAAPQSPTQGVKYLITPQNSRIEFVASKVTGSHNGSFKDFSGAVDYAGQPEKSRVTVAINMASVQTDTDDLTKHLQTPDFFDVAKYPQATLDCFLISCLEANVGRMRFRPTYFASGYLAGG